MKYPEEIYLERVKELEAALRQIAVSDDYYAIQKIAMEMLNWKEVPCQTF